MLKKAYSESNEGVSDRNMEMKTRSPPLNAMTCPVAQMREIKQSIIPRKCLAIAIKKQY
jgi:hypothetical protein